MVEPNELGIGHLFGRVRDAVVVGDATTGNIVLWNPAATEVFGYSSEEATAMAIAELVPVALRDQHREGLRRFAEGGGTTLVHDGTVLELPALHRDGHEIDVELTLTPLEVRPGVPLVLAIVRDVTRKKEAERTLQAAQADAERGNQTLRDFIAMVAHDLRGPLAAVGGFVTLLGGDIPLTAEDKAHMLGRMGLQVRHMEGIVSDLLAATEIESGSVQVSPEAVNVAAAISQAADACGGIEGLSVACPPDIVVWAEPAHVVRSVANVFQNAAKHGRPPVSVDVQVDGGYAQIRICDSGPGLAPHDVDRVFERFTRGSDAGPRPGLGLGLSIVRGLIEANGGSAWYEPNVPTGACFVLQLPRQPSS